MFSVLAQRQYIVLRQTFFKQIVKLILGGKIKLNDSKVGRL